MNLSELMEHESNENGKQKSFDLAPDGKRIVALLPVETPEAQRTQRRVIFLMNFADELNSPTDHSSRPRNALEQLQ